MNRTESDPETATIAAAQNPFRRFAFKPPISRTQGSISLGKRKGSEDKEESSRIKRRHTRQNVLEPPETSSSLASPQSSKVKLYDHLCQIPDHLKHNLNIMFCGINPGQQSAEIGHHYGNPNNHFWSCPHESGLTSRRLDPWEDYLLPDQFSIGLTNLVDRPTVQQTELSRQEQVAAVPSLLQKVSRLRPHIVCFVGLGIAEIVSFSISRSNIGGKKTRSEKVNVGLQAYKMVHNDGNGDVNETLFFAVSSTSGRVVRYQKTDKVLQFKQLHDLWLNLRDGAIDSSFLEPIIL